jgi:hypothetical protein
MTGIERLQNLKKKIPKPKKKIDLIVRGVLIYWVVFVLAAWITFWIKDSVPDTLVQYGLGGGAVELLITGLIEITRDRIAKKEDKG